MPRHHSKVIALLAGILLFTIGVVGHLTNQARTQEADAPSKVSTPTDVLGGQERYLTHLSTDKPIYRPGETIFVRGVILHHASHKPTDSDLIAMVQVIGPKGDQIASGFSRSENSIVGFKWSIPSGQAGGEYKVKVSYPHYGHPPAERKFDIRAFRTPRLKSQIEFLRDGYGPSDQVVATLKTTRAEGGVPLGAPVTIVARLDGREIFRGNSDIDDAGNCVARFNLPTVISRGEGTLAMIIDDGGVVETASKTIPILLQTVDLQLYPEGGDLVAAIENRVYFEAFAPTGKPADLAGTIVDDEGNVVAQFRSEHEGRGRFDFTPQFDQRYFVRIDEPSGINTEYPLPKVRTEGVVLRTANDISVDARIPVLLTTQNAGKYVVTLRKRDIQLDSRTVQLEAGKTRPIELKAGDLAGVLTITVRDQSQRPLAERLVFRNPESALTLRIEADRDRYVPGGKARLTVHATNSQGQPVQALVGLTVTDDSVLELIEKREQAPRLPAMALLESDVRELADAHVYLDPADELAPLATDLLLGTQGWRRFALVNVPQFVKQNGESALRSLAMRVPIEANYRWGGRGGVAREFRNLAGEQDLFFDDGFLAEGEPELAAPLDKAEPAAAAPPPAEQPDASADDEVEDFEAAPAVELMLPRRNKKQRQGRDALEQFRNADARFLDLADEAFVVNNDFLAVRIYAHQIRDGREDGQRVDFTETIFWHAGLQTDAEGRAVVEFDLNDSVTSFRVVADSFSSQGALGTSSTQVESVEPFYAEPKLPLEVTSGDLIQIPIGIVNSTDQLLDEVELMVSSTTWKSIQTDLTSNLSVAPNQRTRRLLGVRVGQFHGAVDLTIKAQSGSYQDEVNRTMRVKPFGFPIEQAVGGMLAANSTVTHEFAIPEDLVPDSLSCRVAVHPTPLARMTDALQRLIQEPNGCFEQTSSSTFPLVMAQQYFMSHTGVDPSLISRSAEMLDKGYERLVGFECKSHGFEWFGNDPGHDALTAYGLLEFTEMSRVRAVDPQLLSRTRQWLLDQRDGKGGFERKTHTLHTWIADPECANTYNTWALLEAGVTEDLSAEIEFVRRTAESSSNSYVIALAANVLSRAGDDETANRLLDKLAGLQSDNGSVVGATTSVVGSGGESLVIETTALAMTAWMTNPDYTLQVEEGIKYLAETCKAGRFGSTQSTILALRAIVQYDRQRATPKSPGALQLFVDGQKVGAPVRFNADTHGVLELPNAVHLMTKGTHSIRVEMSDGSSMPYTVALNYHSTKPDSSASCDLEIATLLRTTKIKEGEVTEIATQVVNRSDKTVPNAVAIVGVPGGLEVRHDQLKELVQEGVIAAYEVLGRELVLYWRSLKANEVVDLPVSVVAEIPGRFQGPASRTYLYYTDEFKHWTEGLVVSVEAK